MNRIKNIFNPYKGLPKEIYILFISRIVSSMGAFVNPLMTLILTKKIGISAQETGVLITILALAQKPAIILGGKLADAIGRRKTIITAQALGVITLFLCGILKPSIFLVYLLMTSSIIFSISRPASEAINADITTLENRQASYSLLYMGFNLGFIIGPSLGGLLFENHLPLLFIGDSLTTLISLILFIIFIKERDSSLDSVDLEVCADNEKAESGSVFSVLKKRPIILYFSLIMLTYEFVYSQWGFAVPIELDTLFSSSGARLFGILSSLNGAIVIILTPILTSLTKNYKQTFTISIGGFLYAISFAMFGFIKSQEFFYLTTFLMTVGEVIISIHIGSYIASHTPSSHRGRVSSIVPLISGMGNALGPIIMGVLLRSVGNLYSWIFVSLVVLIGAIFMYFLAYVEKRSII